MVFRDFPSLPSHAAGGGRCFELDGSTTIVDLATQYGLELPGDAGFETLAGFLLFQLSYIPKPNESLDYAGRRFTISEMDRNRIARVRIEKLPPPETAPEAVVP